MVGEESEALGVQKVLLLALGLVVAVTATVVLRPFVVSLTANEVSPVR